MAGEAPIVVRRVARRLNPVSPLTIHLNGTVHAVMVSSGLDDDEVGPFTTPEERRFAGQ